MFKKIIYTQDQKDLIRRTYESSKNFVETARILNEQGFEINKYQVLRFIHMDSGLCACGKELAPNRKTCPQCLTIARKSHGNSRKQRKQDGVCVQCGNELAPTSRTYCPICLEQNRVNSLELRKERKGKGVCAWCAQPLDSTSKVWCQKHLEQQRKLQLAWRHDKMALPTLERDEWKCVACGTGVEGKYRLEIHHIDGDKTHNVLENLVTLCHPCHLAITNLRVSPNPVGVYEFFKVHYLKA